MDRSELENEPTIKQLFKLLNPSEHTRTNYFTALKHYTEYTGQTPTELIQEAHEDIKAGKLMPERTVFFKIPGFRQFLQGVKSKQYNKPLAQTTLNKYVRDVCSFYNYFYIDTPKLPRSQNKTRTQKDNLKHSNKDEIRKGAHVANLRDRAIVLCGLSSGMAAQELSSLTLQAFHDGYDEETGITTFDMRRQKVGVDFITFISPEASQAVIKYLEWRDRPPARPDNKRDVEEYEKRKTTPKSYLFVSSKIHGDYLQSHDEEVRRCTPRMIIKIYSRLRDYAGIKKTNGDSTYHTFRSHNMRKYFVSNLRNNGCDGDLVEYFIGHTLSGSKSAYYEGDPEKLKEMYQKFIPYLTMAESIDVADTPEFKKVAQENNMLAKVHAEDTIKLRQVEEMAAELAEIKKDRELINEILKRVPLDEILK